METGELTDAKTKIEEEKGKLTDLLTSLGAELLIVEGETIQSKVSSSITGYQTDLGSAADNLQSAIDKCSELESD